MKKIGTILILYIALYALLIFPQSCEDCDGARNHILDTFNVEVKHLTSKSELGYFIFEPYVHTDSGIRYDSVGLVVEPEWQLISYTDNKDMFFNAAFACDAVLRYEAPIDISITSTEDYDAQYPKGSDLKEIISVLPNYRIFGKSLPSLLSETNAETTSTFYGGTHVFIFDTPPSENKTHTLTITYKLKSGKEIQKVVPDIKINK